MGGDQTGGPQDIPRSSASTDPAMGARGAALGIPDRPPHPSLQLTVYLGKRDFVDHIDVVDPVGMWGRGDVCVGTTHFGWGGVPGLGLLEPL